MPTIAIPESPSHTPDLADVVECTLCRAPTHHWHVKMDRDIVRCPKCGLLIVPAGLVYTDSGATIYEDDNCIFFAAGNTSYYLDHTNFRSARLKCDWVRKYLSPRSRLLDAGSNFGHFLSLAQKTYQAVGFELSPMAVEWSRHHLHVDNHVGTVYDPPEVCRGPFDAITFWDVIEHLDRPVDALRQLSTLLKPGGLLFLSTPHAGSLLARLMGRRWHYLDPIQHLHLFSRNNLCAALRTLGFELLAFRAFGHYYRLGYVFDRLSYLHRNNWFGRWAHLGGRILSPVAKLCIYVNLGDVMGVVARKR
jgi:SAM-dependent methyltransferase